eukprot:5465414-Ditylum_brightwellii.AAC.1
MQAQMIARNGTRDNSNNNANAVSPEIKPQQHPVVAPLNNNDHPFVAMPLAAAALGAFLAQYGNAVKKEQQCLSATPVSPSVVPFES